jgi:hypothetical protein
MCLAMLNNNRFAYLVSEANGNIPAIGSEGLDKLKKAVISFIPSEWLSDNMRKAVSSVLKHKPVNFDIALMKELLAHKEYSLHSVLAQLGVDMDFIKGMYENIN